MSYHFAICIAWYFLLYANKNNLQRKVYGRKISLHGIKNNFFQEVCLESVFFPRGKVLRNLLRIVFV